MTKGIGHFNKENVLSKKILERQESIRKEIPQECGPVFIHSDLFRASLFIKPAVNRQEVLERHVEFLRNLLNGHDIWFPSFNYQFPSKGEFSVDTAPCELGPLPEYFRLNHAAWRTPDPVFSACGIGKRPSSVLPEKRIVAFDEKSIFGQLVRQNGFLLFYGLGLSGATILHYAESKPQPPLYRYDKMFRGRVIVKKQSHHVEYLYHVRPLGKEIKYDWDKMLDDSIKEGITRSVGQLAFVIKAQELVKFWGEKLTDDPLYFLDESTKTWVMRKLDQLGRRFEQSDFEQT